MQKRITAECYDLKLAITLFSKKLNPVVSPPVHDGGNSEFNVHNASSPANVIETQRSRLQFRLTLTTKLECRSLN